MTSDPAEAEALSRLHATCFDHGWSAESLSGYLQSLAHCTWVTGPQEAPESFVVLAVVAGEAEVLTLATHPQSRGRGYARAVLQAALADIEARSISLEVATDNEPAQRLYRGLGFHEVGRRKAYYARPDGSRTDALILRLALPGA